jgi:hypothetical protein
MGGVVQAGVKSDREPTIRVFGAGKGEERTALASLAEVSNRSQKKKNVKVK